MTKQRITAPAGRRILNTVCLVFCFLSFSGCSITGRKGKIVVRDDSEQKIPVSILAGFSSTDAGLAEMISRKVTAALPQVELDWETADWGTTFSSLLKAKLSAGDIPDIIIGKAQDAAAYAPTGFLAPVPQSVSDCLRPEYLSAVTVRGTVYGAVFNAVYQGVLYNKNIFWRYGLSIPHTTEELATVVRTLETSGVTPFASHFQENWFTANIMMQFAINELFYQSPEWGQRFNEGSCSFLATPEFSRCFENVRYVFDHSFPDAAVVAQAESDTRFIREQAAMYVTGSWSLQSVHAVNPEMQIGIFPFPNADGTARLIFEPNLTFLKSAETVHSDLVDRILETLFTDKELAENVCSFTQTVSTLRNVQTVFPIMIQPDIAEYAKEGKLIDASSGNNQLVWTFQTRMADSVIRWLQGKLSMRDLLAECDRNRPDNK